MHGPISDSVQTVCNPVFGPCSDRVQPGLNSDRVPDRGSDRGSDRVSDRDPDRVSDRVSDWVSDRVSDRDSDRARFLFRPG